MNSTCRLLLLIAISGAFFASCERHELEDTRILHQHGGHHEEEKAHDNDTHHGGKGDHKKDEHHSSSDQSGNSNPGKTSAGESRNLGI